MRYIGKSDDPGRVLLVQLLCLVGGYLNSGQESLWQSQIELQTKVQSSAVS